MTPEPAPDTSAPAPGVPQGDVATPADVEPQADGPGNTPARVSVILATGAVTGVLGIVSFGLYLLGFFAGVAAVCGLGAIVSGHIGRSVGRRSGVGRGASLGAIVVGWLVVIAVGVGAVLSFMLLAGLASLLPSAHGVPLHR